MLRSAHDTNGIFPLRHSLGAVETKITLVSLRLCSRLVGQCFQCRLVEAVVDELFRLEVRLFLQYSEFQLRALVKPLGTEAGNISISHQIVKRRGDITLIQSAVLHDDVDAGLAIGANPIERL